MRIYEGAFLLAIQSALAGGKITLLETKSGARAIPDLGNSKVHCLILSDSVLLRYTEEKMTSFIDLCSVVGHSINAGIFFGVPIRGCISVGELAIFDGGIKGATTFAMHGLVGKPIVRAYQEEQLYQWVGCTIDDDCLSLYRKFCEQFNGAVDDLATLDYVSDAGLIAQYSAPTKSGQSVLRWVVDWPRYNTTILNEAIVRKCFQRHGDVSQDPSVQAKLENTIAFLEFSNARRT